MTESSNLTVYQQLRAEFGTSDPAKACLELAERIKKLGGPATAREVQANMDEEEKKLRMKERMAKARAARKAKNVES